jgi:hypothetical protein
LGTFTPDVVRPVDLLQVGDLPVRRLHHAGVLELELLDHVGDPALAEAFPGQHVDRPGAQQRPQSHLDGTGIGRRHDADAIVGGNAQERARSIDRLDDLLLGRLGSVRPPDGGIFEKFGRPARTLGAGSG